MPRPAKISSRFLAHAAGLLALFTLAAIAAPAPAVQAPVTVEEGLREVLDDALAANLELRAGTAAVQQRLAALDQARARYLPALDIAAPPSTLPRATAGRTAAAPSSSRWATC